MTEIPENEKIQIINIFYHNICNCFSSITQHNFVQDLLLNFYSYYFPLHLKARILKVSSELPGRLQ